MNDMNYIGGIVKILEPPKYQLFKNNISITKCRVQLPQVRKTQIVTLLFWGNLARDVANYYKINDYLLIEGYLSVKGKSISKLSVPSTKRISVTVLKVYPFLLGYNKPSQKIQN